jgi:hypothetical protein
MPRAAVCLRDLCPISDHSGGVMLLDPRQHRTSLRELAADGAPRTNLKSVVKNYEDYWRT